MNNEEKEAIEYQDLYEKCKKEKNANIIHYNYWNRFESILQSLYKGVDI